MASGTVDDRENGERDMEELTESITDLLSQLAVSQDELSGILGRTEPCDIVNREDVDQWVRLVSEFHETATNGLQVWHSVHRW